MTTVTQPPRRRLSLDRNIERLREQLDQLASYLGKRKITAAWKSSIWRTSV